jgi:hypothetical protein
MWVFPLNAVLTILGIHIIADFFCQTQWMARNKSYDFIALGAHAIVYGLILYLFAPLVVKTMWSDGNFTQCLGNMWSWIVLNTGLHFAIDAITSRINAYWVGKFGFARGFFNTVAIDQFIHFTCLFYTLSAVV